MTRYCRDAYHTQLPSEYETGFDAIGRDATAEWQIPLRWVTVSIFGLSLISVAIGLGLQWLLR